MQKKKVVLGMSGGVDSSVAAYLLQKEGYEVIGVTMNVWKKEGEEMIERKGGCCGLSDIEDARRIADKLDIEHHILNFRGDFQRKVVQNFIEEYKEGRTPNPCIACNRYVKWQSLLAKTILFEADFISTGHYATIIKNPINGRFAIKISEGDGHKDQSYVLFNLSQEQLARSIFPIGKYSKDKIREMAKNIDVIMANKPDSQDICFIPDNNYGEFLEEQLDKIKEGNFLDVNGNIIGRHKGIIYYTIGQRKNLGTSFGVPMYVKEIRPKSNEVVLASDSELFEKNLVAYDLNFMYLSKEEIGNDMEVYAKIRYSHTPSKAFISLKQDKIYGIFEEAQRAITKGQAVVFYDKEGHIIAGGTIC